MTDQITEIEVEAEPIGVDSLPIELYKALKIANLVSGGGEAKFVISEGYVAVNGELEQRKRRKLEEGDIIEFNGEYYFIEFQPQVDFTPDVAPPVSTPVVSSPAPSVSAEPKKAKPKKEKRDGTTGRKAISF